MDTKLPPHRARHAAAALVAGLLAVPLSHADSSSGAASSAGATVATQSPNYTEPVVRLQQAAQKLRESIQAMAQQPAGERRNQALQQAREALVEAQGAMFTLPPELRTRSGGDAANETKSMERLQEAAQRLREAAQAMAQQPAGPRRNEAIRRANEALLETQQAMLQLPPELRSTSNR